MNTNTFVSDKLESLLQTPQNIVITPHLKPDGDAIGSSLALYLYLSAQGHQVELIAPTDYPSFLYFLPSTEKVVFYEKETEKSNALLKKADLLFVLDYSTKSRAGNMGDAILAANATKIIIDHHIAPDLPCDYLFWDTSVSSTSELVYQLLALLNATNDINTDIATCLYAGIVSDTGRFKFNTQPNTHAVVGDLIARGNLDVEEINSHIFDNYDENRLRFTGFCLSERMKIWWAYKTAVIYLHQADFERFNQTDTIDLVNYPLKLQGIRFVVLMKEKGDIVKISFRSKGEFSVNDFSRQHFGGGGHKNAAGAVSKNSLSNILADFESLLPQYEQALNAS